MRTLSLLRSLDICTTLPPTAMPDASAICSRGHEPSAAEASSKTAKQMCCYIIFLIARKALQPSEAADPSPPSGKAAPGFCHWPRILDVTVLRRQVAAEPIGAAKELLYMELFL